MAAGAGGERAVILLMLVGGPSQLETWDPKPDAPAEVRGPFGSIATAVPGVRINEHLPRLAQRLDRLTLIRSMHHDAAPIHETGHQLLQTGRLCRHGEEHPHFGSVVARVTKPKSGVPPFVVVPGPIGHTGVNVSHGQTAGALGRGFEPIHLRSERSSTELGAFDLSGERASVRESYGPTRFGQGCLLARRLVESGVRVVAVNMFETVFNRISWDCHGSRPFSTLDDYAAEVLPTLDQAFSALLDDLQQRGLLETTLVVATGEFGRTPRLNAAGGRDHWPSVWSAVLAGGGTQGGQVIGASDKIASTPSDRPVQPGELVATMYRSLGIDSRRSLDLGQGESLALVEGAEPIAEAFA
ncbi:DUF1501 domain-containing protein [Singulisphaera sp. GP187]|uniref:DUF1501 domain-containing protein n=1 Tax=Singulisphaera sp. GP187 TaxID=1882752 RepID=UPI0009FA0DF8|nr:DUF1501 domain-containing protein [Singulisphaera sp. GP187]